MDTQLPPIYMVPEVQEKVLRVKQYINGMVRAKNFFGWRFFIEDLKVDIETEIYKYEELHRQGKYKENTIGHYCNMAMQGAINYAAMCSAKKRRLNFESSSLDALIETEKGSMALQIPASSENEFERVELLMAIRQTFGDQIEALARQVLDGGEPLTKAQLKLLRVPKMRKILSDEA